MIWSKPDLMLRLIPHRHEALEVALGEDQGFLSGMGMRLCNKCGKIMAVGIPEVKP